jgi:hypothetical protein
MRVTDFEYVARNLDYEAEIHERMSDSFRTVGMEGPATRMTLSAQRLRELARWTRDKITEGVNEIVQHERQSWEGMNTTLAETIAALPKRCTSGASKSNGYMEVPLTCRDVLDNDSEWCDACKVNVLKTGQNKM